MHKRKETTPETFNQQNYHALCMQLAKQDKDLAAIMETLGYPPMWTRANTFETVVHIILEQQVSLASALAALNKLKEKTQQISPEAMLRLSDEEMRACYVSRQKAAYIKSTAQAITDGTLDLEALAIMTDDQIRTQLISLKGIGNWTIDIYLMFALQRADIFPIGDLAAVNAIKRLKQLPPGTTKEELLRISESWQPFRSVASMILWHYYLSRNKPKTKSA